VWRQGAAEVAAVALTAVIVAGLGLYTGRRAIAGGVAEDWLRSEGLPGEVAVDRISPDGFSGRLRVGRAGDPDLTVDRIEVDLGFEPAWADQPFKLSTRAVRLVRPRLKARLDGRGLTFGALDPLVREFLNKPKTDEPGPAVLIEDGAVRLDTPYGLLRLRGSGALDDGKLVRFDGRLRPARLKGDGVAATIADGTVRLHARDDRLTGRAALNGAEAQAFGLTLLNGQLVLDVDLPYPEGQPVALDGPAVLRAELRAGNASGGGARAERLTARAVLQGRTTGPIAALRFDGTGEFDGSAAQAGAGTLAGRALSGRIDASRIALGGGEAGVFAALAGTGRLNAARATIGADEAQAVSVMASSRALRFDDRGLRGPLALTLRAARYARPDLQAAGLRLTAETDARLLGSKAPVTLAATGAADRLSASWDGQPVALDAVRARFSGPATTADGFRWRAQGGASASGALDARQAAGLADRVPVLGEADSHRAAILEALRQFTLDAPGLALELGPTNSRISASAPVRLRAASGAQLTAAGAPLVLAGREGTSGELNLTVRGGGLPTAELTLSDWRASPAGFDSPVRLKATGLTAAIARGASVDARGRARSRGGAFSFDLASCAPVSAEQIEFGENDLADASGQICPSGGPLITADASGYAARGVFRNAALAAPIAEARADAGEGTFALTGGESGLRTADVRLRSAFVADQAAETRYLPLRLSGGIGLRRGLWSGPFEAATREGVRLAGIDVRHEDASGVGSATIDGRGVAFAPGALQPEQLSPLLAGIAADARGGVDFTGRYDWRPGEDAVSSGRLVTRGLDFVSPAGAVTAVSADVAFISLTPLLTAPDQVVTVSRVDAIAEVTNATTAITLNEDAIRLESTAFDVGGGQVRIEAMTIPLDGSGTYDGILVVDGVQLGALVEALNLGEAMNLDAVVDGRIPFEISPGKVRFTQGRLTATKPGRLSVRRSALTGVSAEPAASPGAPAPEGQINAIQDFAYQAMENLAFSELELTIDSLPEGRLGLLFRIRGEHDPEVAEEARVGFFEALRGRAFQRRIPLPKGTPVNLTLDTTLNFDELLHAWLEIGRRRAEQAESRLPRSTPVQPGPATQAP
jgi:hypothetical protein